jgi:2-aminobenzoate-CoA ligase
MSYDSFVRDRLPSNELLPEFRFDLPALHYPERFNAAAELLKRGKPDDLAIVNAHGRWSYAELNSFSGRIARLLVEEKGLVPGNRVLLRGPNGYTLFAAWLGVLKAGGVVVTTMPLLRPGEIAAAPPRRDCDGDRYGRNHARHRRQPLYRRFPCGDEPDPPHQAPRQI